ncbi:Rieske (2Fe-2S) protein [Paenibacillus sp. YYML68]|uniref:Rieske (2Fe-2S) protein n=1 Tax=Paenibacillus sp. YYML68 TaxID=2909250 RepID=UPI0024911ACB|nr:Rieske (2Fe-2S) protein [Paenibacillus sp. YYML68]
MKEVVLGAVSEFVKLPAEVSLEHRPYYLMKGADGYRLMSRLCPHAGAWVEAEGGELYCPMHGWEFHTETGACLNVPTKSLACYSVDERDGILVALLEV